MLASFFSALDVALVPLLSKCIQPFTINRKFPLHGAIWVLENGGICITVASYCDVNCLVLPWRSLRKKYAFHLTNVLMPELWKSSFGVLLRPSLLKIMSLSTPVSLRWHSELIILSHAKQMWKVSFCCLCEIRPTPSTRVKMATEFIHWINCSCDNNCLVLFGIINSILLCFLFSAIIHTYKLSLRIGIERELKWSHTHTHAQVAGAWCFTLQGSVWFPHRLLLVPLTADVTFWSQSNSRSSQVGTRRCSSSVSFKRQLNQHALSNAYEYWNEF